MKPVNVSAQPAKAQPAVPSAPAGLNSIDLSSLDRLDSLRQEKARVEGFRARAEEKKQGVADAVYTRVMDDYRKRSAALDKESAPLLAQARTEYVKLNALLDELGRKHEQARQQKEEIEFRHSVGELSEAERSEQVTSPQNVLDECETEQHALDATRARFVSALEPAASPVNDPPAANQAPPSPDAGLDSKPSPPPEEADADATMALPKIGRRAAPPAGEYAARPIPEASPKGATKGRP